MSKPVTIPNVFATQSGNVPASELDADYNVLSAAINDFVTYANFLSDAGAVNAIVVSTPANTTFSLVGGVWFDCMVANANTSASVTANPNGLGATPVRDASGNALAIGALQANTIYRFVYDGAAFFRVIAQSAVPFYPPTATEISAASTIVAYFYAPGDVRRYGADPLGVADSATAYQQASNSNLKVDMPEGTYKIAVQVTCVARPVTYIGAARGATKLILSTNTDAFKWSGAGSGGGMKRCVLQVSGMTGGYALSVTTQGRWLAEDMNVITNSTGAGAFYAADFNSVTFRDIWLNGSYGTNGAAIYLFGSGAASALVADINNVQYGGSGGASATSSYGLVVDGGVATVNIRSFSSVACFCGVITLNTSAVTNFAQFIEGDNVQVDGCYGDGIVLGTAGAGNTTGHNFAMTYVHHTGQNNSGAGIGKGTGIYIYANCRASRFQGGDILTCNLGGMFIDGNNIQVSDMDIRKNSQDAVGTYPAIQLGANSFGNNIHHNTLGQNSGAATSDQSYGVQIDLGSSQNIVVHNYMLLNTLGAILDNSGDTNSIIKDNLYAGNSTFHSALGPAAMAATVNNYNPTSWNVNVTHLRLTPAAGGTTVNGLFSGTVASVWIHGSTLVIENLSSADSLTFTHLNASSNSWNRFSLKNAVSLVLAPFESRQFMYNTILSKWQAI